MVRSQGGGRSKIRYYQCRTYRDQSKTVCAKHSVRADALEEAVFYALKLQMALSPSLRETRKAVEQALSDKGGWGKRRAAPFPRSGARAVLPARTDSTTMEERRPHAEEYRRL
jgi:hypothetical protein